MVAGAAGFETATFGLFAGENGTAVGAFRAMIGASAAHWEK
jgi:hypothetical protein